MLEEENYTPEELKEIESRLVAPENTDVQEEFTDYTLRPQSLAEFVGQEHIKEPLSISIKASQQRKEPIEHVLLYGNPGLGKTTLANIIAKEMGVNIRAKKHSQSYLDSFVWHRNNRNNDRQRFASLLGILLHA